MAHVHVHAESYRSGAGMEYRTWDLVKYAEVLSERRQAGRQTGKGDLLFGFLLAGATSRYG